MGNQVMQMNLINCSIAFFKLLRNHFEGIADAYM